MKRVRTRLLILILPGLFCFISTSGQYQPGLYKLRYSDSGGERGLTTYVYTSDTASPIKAIWELEDGSRWSVNYHTFDQNGNMLTKHRLFSDSIVVDQTFSYNESGQIVSETFYRSDGVRGTVCYLYEENIIATAECSGFNGWFHGRIEYKHNSDRLKDSAVIYSKDGVRLGTILYLYDNNKQLIEERWEFANGAWQNYAYEYTDNECVKFYSSNIFIRPSCKWIIESETYSFSGSAGGPSNYYYDDSMKLTGKVFVRSDGLRTETKYYYREGGLLEKSVRKYSDDSEGIFYYTYDDQMNLTERTFYRCDTLNGSEKYYYDSSGKLIKGELFNFDSWLTGSLSFNHDMYNRVSKAEFLSESPGLNASISFIYDQNSNLIKIHWLFGNGSTQTYNFKYRYTQNHRF